MEKNILISAWFDYSACFWYYKKIRQTLIFQPAWASFTVDSVSIFTLWTNTANLREVNTKYSRMVENLYKTWDNVREPAEQKNREVGKNALSNTGNRCV